MIKEIKYITRQDYDKKVRECGDLGERETVAMIDDIMSKGGMAFIKFVCQYCGARQTSSDPNTIHKMGYVCEECGEVSRPQKYGLQVAFTNISIDDVKKILKGV